jgi:hypothetical protein
MLSTESLLALETPSCEHVPMSDATIPATVSGRIDYVMRECRYPSQSALAEALGLKSNQVITNWRSRDSIGRAGPRLREVTGVSTDWMQGGVGEPFPGGPIPYSGPMPADAETLEKIQRGMDGIGLAVIVLCKTVSARSPAEARELQERLTAALEELERAGRKAPFLKNLLDTVAGDQSRSHPHPRGRRE